MGVHKFTDAKIYIAEFDVSGDHNVARITQTAEALDKTVFGNSTRQQLGGLTTFEVAGEGLVNYGTNAIEEILSAKIGVADVAMTVAAEGADAGEDVAFFKALFASLAPLGGSVGEIHRFRIGAQPSNSPLVRGKVFIARAARTASFNSSVIQLGTVSATQRLYAAMHVFSASGTLPTLDAIVKSDDAAGFLSPTSRITFAQATGKTSAFKSVDGAITDDFIRVDVTIGGTGPSFDLVCVVGIGPF